MPSVNDHLDACFLPLGLQPTDGIAGRNYEGEITGRSVTVHCSARRRTQYVGADIRVRRHIGYRLEISAETTRQTRLVLPVVKGVLMQLAAHSNRLFGAERLAEKPAGLAHVDVWAHDPVWAQLLLANGPVQARLATLLPAANLPPNIGLRLWPGMWTFSQRTSLADITPENTRAWVTALIELAHLAEQAPPLNRTADLTRLERLGKERPVLLGLVLAGLLLGVPVVLAGCVVIAALALVVLTGA